MQASRPLVVCSHFSSPRLPSTPNRQVSVDHNAALHGVELQDIQLHRISLMERSRVVRGMMTCALWLAPLCCFVLAACGFFLGVPQDGELAQCGGSCCTLHTVNTCKAMLDWHSNSARLPLLPCTPPQQTAGVHAAVGGLVQAVGQQEGHARRTHAVSPC